MERLLRASCYMLVMNGNAAAAATTILPKAKKKEPSVESIVSTCIYFVVVL